MPDEAQGWSSHRTTTTTTNIKANMSEIIHSDSAPGIDVNLGPQIVVATWVLTSLSALFLLMRVFGKLWTARKLLVDDYVLVTAWVRAACVASSQYFFLLHFVLMACVF